MRYSCSIVVEPPLPPPRGSCERSICREQASVNSECSSAHLAGIHCSYRYSRILASRPMCTICRHTSSGSSTCHLGLCT